MSDLVAPPSYDDVVSQEDSVQPSAPYLSQITTGGQPLPHYEDTDTRSAPHGQTRRSTPNTNSGTRVEEKLIDRYITYSIARHLRKYIEPKTDPQDPELDVEAEFGRSAVRSAQMAIEKKRRLQCISGWLWCIGVMLVLVYIALPIAMILIGALGIGNCPFRNNTLIVYLLGGGGALALLVVLRALPSIMTCIRNRNYCSTRETNTCGGCICAAETIFYIVLFINFVVLILGTYTTFVERKPPDCPAVGPCCDTFVYISCATVSVVQFVLYLFSGLYVCLVMCCIRSMDKECRL